MGKSERKKMESRHALIPLALAALLALGPAGHALAQADAAAQAASAPAAEAAPQPLTDAELEVLVARIALYPDELVAVIVSASFFPIQIVEAARFLDKREKDKELKPKDDWDGSVISLLNYPEIVAMMSDDLDWTEAIAQAISYQEKDVLAAIQQLREQAVANDFIKTDDKIKVVEENDNIVIQSADPQVIYVPQYEPQMLYVPNYPVVPITYWPDPYPLYYWPGATFFAGVVTGAVWGGIVDWNDGFWGGNWRPGDVDIDIDCNKCFNNIDFDGKINFNDVDWTKIDRDKISIDRNQFAKIDRTKIKNDLKTRDFNKVSNKVGDLGVNRPTTLPAGRQPKDIRKSTLEGLKGQQGNLQRPAAGDRVQRPATADIKKPDLGNIQKPDLGNVQRPDRGNAGKDLANIKRPDIDKVTRPAGQPKPLAKVDSRPRNPSPVGDIKGGAKVRLDSARGAKAMGGGVSSHRGGGGGQKIRAGGGGGHKSISRGGGGRRR
jgi:hypothetical protein